MSAANDKKRSNTRISVASVSEPRLSLHLARKKTPKYPEAHAPLSPAPSCGSLRHRSHSHVILSVVPSRSPVRRCVSRYRRCVSRYRRLFSHVRHAAQQRREEPQQHVGEVDEHGVLHALHAGPRPHVDADVQAREAAEYRRPEDAADTKGERTDET